MMTIKTKINGEPFEIEVLARVDVEFEDGRIVIRGDKQEAPSVSHHWPFLPNGTGRIGGVVPFVPRFTNVC